jgi:hypothetical protein
MNIKRKILFLFIGLLMTFLLPNYAMAAFTFTAHDTKGKLLKFANPKLIVGTRGTCTTDIDAAPCADDGDYGASEGAKYEYTNVITVDGVQIDATVSVDKIVNATLLRFDDSTPDPTGSSRANKSTYTTSFGVVVNEADVFAPQIKSSGFSSESYVKFTVSFFDSSGKPAVLKNVYNNTLDAESTEYNAYGGFSSYRLAPDNATNLKRIIATPVLTPGLNGNIRFSSTDCTGDTGLFIKDQSRVQTKFDTITSLTITNGQFANGTVPKVGGGYSTCTNGNQRYYGAIFAQDEFIDTPGTPIEYTVPTVNFLTTSNTKPTITGTIGGNVSGTSAATPSGSALSGTDTFSVFVNGVTYSTTPAALTSTQTSGKLTVLGTTWSLQFLTPLTAGQSYEVVATRNGILVDQTNNELVITPDCSLRTPQPQVLNATSTDCVIPTASDTLWCHSGDGVSYSKSILAATDYTHITHEFDQEAVGGKCPDDVITCTPPEILNAAGTACVTPVTNGTACTPITDPLTNIPADSDYDGKKISICHFPPGNPDNVRILSVGISSIKAHVDEHGDTIWQSGKACPATTTSCDTPPTVANKSTTEGTAVALTGTAGSSNTILSVTLTKTKDGLGATTTGTPTAVLGTPLTATATGWTVSSGTAVAIGTYTITATDGNSLSATGTLTVTCPADKITAANACTTPIIPTVENKTTTDKVAVLLTGTVGTSTSLQIQVKNSAGAIQDSGTAAIIGSTWSFMPKVLPAGVYSIVAIGDAAHGNLTNTGTLTVTTSVNPTVDTKTTTEKVAVPLTGSVGSSASLTITVKDSSGISKATGAATITGTTWTYMPIVLPAGTYDVVAEGDATHGSLVDGTKDELVVTASPTPTVESQTTYDTTPVIKGTVGTSALETNEAFTVSVNGKTYTNSIDTNLKVTGTNWELTILAGNEIPGSATAYPVVATRGSAPDTKTGTGDLTIMLCALPKVVNAAKTACVAPVPTVISQTINSNTAVSPVIKGTVGEVELDSTETFSVTIKTTPPQIYTNKTDVALSVSGLNWTLTVPSNKAILAGTYDVEAARNTSAKDVTSGELIINLVCNPTETAVNGACVPTASLCTIVSSSTDDTTPTITGTVGGSELAVGESFAVSVNGQSYSPTPSGTAWSLTVPNALGVGSYPVQATRGNLTCAGTVTITACTLPKVVNATTGDCSEPSTVPTVTPSASHNIQEPSIVVEGTVGDTELSANDSFSVKIHNSEHSNVNGALVVTGKAWTFTLTERFVGTFDVDAVRNSKYDVTNGELTITGNLCCINGKTTQCLATISVPNYAGECSVPVCPSTNAAGNCTSPLPDPKKEETLPSKPNNKVPEAIVPPTELGYCDDGGQRSYGASTSGATIKRARIANAETTGGTFETTALVGMKVIYGTLTAGTYDDTNNSCQQGYCTNKTITGATLTGAIVDIATDYVDADGYIIDNNNRGIALTGGVTNPTSLKNDGVTVINATITNGMITAGTDSDGNPIRGSITNGGFAAPITHGTSVLTKGRRTQGTLSSATISGATITTVGGVSIVGCDRSLDSMHTPCTVGTITSGTMDKSAKTFGTVENATLTNATITGSNQCFSSGTVGKKGQLNWKEVVK